MSSTGGIIALGLGINNWSVGECITHFEELCDKAFTRRVGGNIPGLGWFIDNYNHSKYETQPLEEALKSAFTETQYLFGGPRTTDVPNCDIKVGVTATSSAGSSVLLTNYNRLCAEKCEREIWFAVLAVWILTAPSAISLLEAGEVVSGIEDMGSVSVHDSSR
jgi:hypothetical protein